MPLNGHDTAAELSATAADIAAAISDGREPPAAWLARAACLLDALTGRTAPACPSPRPAGDLAGLAAIVTGHLRDCFDPATLPVQQVLCLAEEAGEFTAAYRRWAGMARRTGAWGDVCDELADVVITAYVTASVLGIDLDDAWRAKAEVILSRGWREQAPQATP
jgi:NTP pyrophosphatase (non-canonical NTP hydrolase)